MGQRWRWVAERGEALHGRIGLVRSGDDRGDVPGWVMIAVMTAGLVIAIMVPFRATIIPAMTGAIQDMFGQAR